MEEKAIAEFFGIKAQKGKAAVGLKQIEGKIRGDPIWSNLIYGVQPIFPLSKTDIVGLRDFQKSYLQPLVTLCREALAYIDDQEEKVDAKAKKAKTKARGKGKGRPVTTPTLYHLVHPSQGKLFEALDKAVTAINPSVTGQIKGFSTDSVKALMVYCLACRLGGATTNGFSAVLDAVDEFQSIPSQKSQEPGFMLLQKVSPEDRFTLQEFVSKATREKQKQRNGQPKLLQYLSDDDRIKVMLNCVGTSPLRWGSTLVLTVRKGSQASEVQIATDVYGELVTFQGRPQGPLKSMSSCLRYKRTDGAAELQKRIQRKYPKGVPDSVLNTWQQHAYSHSWQNGKGWRHQAPLKINYQLTEVAKVITTLWFVHYLEEKQCAINGVSLYNTLTRTRQRLLERQQQNNKAMDIRQQLLVLLIVPWWCSMPA